MVHEVGEGGGEEEVLGLDWNELLLLFQLLVCLLEGEVVAQQRQQQRVVHSAEQVAVVADHGAVHLHEPSCELVFLEKGSELSFQERLEQLHQITDVLVPLLVSG